MLELNGVTSLGHVSLIRISLPLRFYDCMYESVYLKLTSTVTRCPSAYLTLHLLLYPDFPIHLSNQYPPPPSSCCYNRTNTFACLGLSTHCHQAFLMLLHSAAAVAVSSFSLSPLWLCLLLLSPGVVSLPSTPSEVMSHRDYSLIPDESEIFIRDDVRHVK